ncbi:MAG: DUF1836 domain-containing protein [Lachnospiraceae bacterium]|nr:DUF1836 domain-containing protein [Lachnospiraceae bacterium]
MASNEKGNMEKVLRDVMDRFTSIEAEDIPKIELYMDQVLTFMQENLAHTSRNPGEDKILTKAMINNYVKNKVLIPPVKKKYGVDHMLLLIFIYYLKSSLSIDDIRKIIAPVAVRYAQTPPGKGGEKNQPQEERRQGARITIPEIYTKVFEDVGAHTADFSAEMEALIRDTEHSFDDEGLTGRERELLRRFDLICQLAADIYIRKLYIEKLLDSDKTT